jgi:splicing factor 3A subunit 1
MTEADGVGLIVPPPNVRGVLEKTAQHIGKLPSIEKQSAFAAKILQKHAADPSSVFSFLRPEDPYHAYYVSILDAARAPAPAQSSAQAPVALPVPDVPPPSALPFAGNAAADTAATASIRTLPGVMTSTQEVAPAVSKLNAARLKAQKKRLTPTEPPPADIYSVPDVVPLPESLTLDVIKLTAQFAARHGREFTSSLAGRETRNPLFDFLKPMHPHFIVFERMIEAYTAILSPPNGRETLLHRFADEKLTRGSLLDQAWYRHDWRNVEQSRETSTDDKSSFDISSDVAVIDWHDFVVLETIDIDEAEVDLPAPLADPTQIPRVMAAAEAARQELEKDGGGDDMDMDMDIDEGDEGDEGDDHAMAGSSGVVIADVDAAIPTNRIRKAAAAPAVPVMATGYDATMIVGDADMRGAPAALKEVTVTLPDGQVVPMSEATQAMRAQLIDPKYKEERQRAAEKNQRQNLADGEQMAQNLARLNRDKPDSGVYNRSDLQGSLAGRAQQLSGLPASAPLLRKAALSGPQLPAETAAAAATAAAIANAGPGKEERTATAVGVLANAATKAAELAELNALGPMPDPDEPVAPLPEPKTPVGLLSEEEWITRVGEKVQICIKIPVNSNPDWSVQGQDINVEVPLRITVVKLKEKLAKVIKLPANKQKLQYGDSGFMKDIMSLGFYNVAPGSIVKLVVKERSRARTKKKQKGEGDAAV